MPHATLGAPAVAGRQDSSVEDMLTKSDNVTFVACVCNAVVTARWSPPPTFHPLN